MATIGTGFGNIDLSGIDGKYQTAMTDLSSSDPATEAKGEQEMAMVTQCFSAISEGIHEEAQAGQTAIQNTRT